MVTQRNWYEVYPWATWGGNDKLPTFTEGQTFVPTELVLKRVSYISYISVLHVCNKQLAVGCTILSLFCKILCGSSITHKDVAGKK
jgi:hypothetical protein